jgi:Glutathionylspermidine synthase preATP-grasp
MQRHTIAPRDNWQGAVEEQGLIWHSDADGPYWDESAYYSFTLDEIERFEAASETVYQLFLEAGDWIVGHKDVLEQFGIRTIATGRSAPRGSMSRPRSTMVGSTLAIMATAIPSCSNSTAIRRPRCSRPQWCNGTGRKPASPISTSITACTKS